MLKKPSSSLILHELDDRLTFPVESDTFPERTRKVMAAARTQSA